MEDVDTVVAKLEEYARMVSARERARASFRDEGFALVRRRLEQTQAIVARITQQTKDSSNNVVQGRLAYYDAQQQAELEAMRRLQEALTRRGKALHDLKTILEEQEK